MYKQQTLIVSLNFTKIINLFFKSDWLITMSFQGQQSCWSRNMLHLVKSGSATVSISLTLYGYVWNGIQQFYSYYFCIITVCSIQIPRWSTTFAKIFTTILSNKAHVTISQNAMCFTWPSIPIVMSELYLTFYSHCDECTRSDSNSRC